MPFIFEEFSFNGGMLKVVDSVPAGEKGHFLGELVLIEHYRQYLNAKNVIGNIEVTIPELRQKFAS